MFRKRQGPVSATTKRKSRSVVIELTYQSTSGGGDFMAGVGDGLVCVHIKPGNVHRNLPRDFKNLKATLGSIFKEFVAKCPGKQIILKVEPGFMQKAGFITAQMKELRGYCDQEAKAVA